MRQARVCHFLLLSRVIIGLKYTEEEGAGTVGDAIRIRIPMTLFESKLIFDWFMWIFIYLFLVEGHSLYKK